MLGHDEDELAGATCTYEGPCKTDGYLLFVRETGQLLQAKLTFVPSMLPLVRNLLNPSFDRLQKEVLDRIVEDLEMRRSVGGQDAGIINARHTSFFFAEEVPLDSPRRKDKDADRYCVTLMLSTRTHWEDESQ